MVFGIIQKLNLYCFFVVKYVDKNNIQGSQVERLDAIAMLWVFAKRMFRNVKSGMTNIIISALFETGF